MLETLEERVLGYRRQRVGGIRPVGGGSNMKFRNCFCNLQGQWRAAARGKGKETEQHGLYEAISVLLSQERSCANEVWTIGHVYGRIKRAPGQNLVIFGCVCVANCVVLQLLANVWDNLRKNGRSAEARIPNFENLHRFGGTQPQDAREEGAVGWGCW